MEEQEFKQTHATVNPSPCYFAKAILCQCSGCAHAQKIHIAERESMACRDASGHQRCGAWLEQLYKNARFTLKLPAIEAPIPHAKAMKLQCGSPRGLRAALDNETDENPQAVTDINALLERGLAQYGHLEHLPYSQIMRFVHQYTLKKRSRRR